MYFLKLHLPLTSTIHVGKYIRQQDPIQVIQKSTGFVGFCWTLHPRQRITYACVFLFEAQTQKTWSTSWPLLLGSNRCVLLDLPGTSVAWHVLESALDILSWHCPYAPCMIYIHLYMNGWFFMVNVGKYTIDGSYGFCFKLGRSVLSHVSHVMSYFDKLQTCVSPSSKCSGGSYANHKEIQWITTGGDW